MTVFVEYLLATTQQIMKLRLIAITVSLTALHQVQAATIMYSGVNTNIDTTADDGATSGWHSTGNVKSLDIDGDNALGSEGWIRASNGSSGISNPRRSLPSYIVAYNTTTGDTAATTTFANSVAGTFMDNPATGGINLNPANEDVFASWHSSNANETNLFSFSIQNANQLTNRILRVGVLFDAANLAPGVDATQSILITQTVGGSVFAFSPQISYGANGLDVAYFDLTGVANLDKFVISADAAGTGGRSHIAGITFDSAIPEPSSALLSGIGVLLLLRRRR